MLSVGQVLLALLQLRFIDLLLGVVGLTFTTQRPPDLPDAAFQLLQCTQCLHLYARLVGHLMTKSRELGHELLVCLLVRILGGLALKKLVVEPHLCLRQEVVHDFHRVVNCPLTELDRLASGGQQPAVAQDGYDFLRRTCVLHRCVQVEILGALGHGLVQFCLRPPSQQAVQQRVHRERGIARGRVQRASTQGCKADCRMRSAPVAVRRAG
mmetsp:Transcript_56464/g.131572  ORF Transcript_56464/g.131572 Transcript_56464/m.131572 type:complete len:211 (-) Transcript_56464:2-634(-)